MKSLFVNCIFLKSKLSKNSFFSLLLFLVFNISMLWLALLYSAYLNAVLFVVDFVFLLFVDETSILSFIFSLTPFATVFKISPQSTSFITILELCSVVVLFFKTRKKDDRFLIYLLFFSLYLVLGQLVSSISINNMIKKIFDFGLLFFTLQIAEDINKERIMFFYIFGVFVSSLFAYYGSEVIPSFFLYVKKIGVDTNITYRFSGTNGDPNYYSMDLILAFSCAIFYHKKHRIMFWVVLAMTLYFGVRTFSKSFFIYFIIAILCAFVVFVKQRTYFSALLIILFSIVFLIIILNGSNTYLTTIINRFAGSSDLSSITTGRTDLWESYLRDIVSSPKYFIFGHGLGADLLNGAGVHNFYIELFYYFGFIGTMLYLVIVFRCLRCSPSKCVHRFSNIFMLILFAIMMFGLQALFMNETIMQLGICFLAMTTKSSSVANQTAFSCRRLERSSKVCLN